MKLALFSPVPPERSGIADYTALLLPALRERAEIQVVKRGAKRPPRGSDLAVYHMGNDPAVHGWILEALHRTPGAVVLHDFVLHHLVSGVTLARGNVRGYLDALERDGGLPARLLGHAVIEKRIPPLWENRAVDLPLAGAVLDHATGLVVHSRYVHDRARAAGFGGPIEVIPHPAWVVPEDIAPAALEGSPLIAAFGNLNESKRLPQLLEAFARVRTAHPDARLLLVGAASPNFDLQHRLQRLALDSRGVEQTGYVSETELWSLMAAADIHVNLRAPTMGETSGTAIRALCLGKPLVVSDIGWFAELPGEVALKVAVDDDEVETLAAALTLLTVRPDVRAAMGAAASVLARGAHEVARVAEAQVHFFEQLVGDGWVADAVLGDVSTAAAEVGIEPRSADAVELARRLSEVDLGG
jgi:glycosyltransferase involved in cell wall biosynthesis